MKNKKALSQIVSTVLLILISVVFIAGIWGIVNNFVNNRLERANSCSNIFEKISVNDDYTCYNASNSIMQISIKRGDVDLTGLLVGISTGDESKTFFLKEEDQTIIDVRNYPDNSSLVRLPSKEGGLTYYVYNINSEPEKIELAPNINNYQCASSDVVSKISRC